MDSNPEPLYLKLGIPGDEGLVAGYIPVFDTIPQEFIYRDGARTFIMYAIDGTVLDMIAEDQKPVKWWLVKQACHNVNLGERVTGLSPIETFYSGRADEFRVESLPSSILDRKPEGHQMAVRMYKQGPWVKLDQLEQA